jgi:predicted ATPase with chaperone activity
VIAKQSLNAREHNPISKVARTIADLAGAGARIAQAIRYRTLNQAFLA